ncbi:dihydrofolate reductase family protein [Nocardia flavorosea]|uniref:dihydrofolate reductase family protein n=1 Tax=Nocardia flavorosea TaxID=53429 RepID=UPI000A45557D|nr:dihydrofolate reductase family protein [Nocardia flavorosea]
MLRSFDNTTKYVVGAREPQAEWANSISLGAYDPEKIPALEADIDARIYISGSGTLVRALLAEGLVDDLRLFVCPVALGRDEKLFTDGADPTKLELNAHDVYANGVVHLNYGPARP